MAQYRLNDSLGLVDARKCVALGSHIVLEPAKLAKGETVDLSEAAVEYLTVSKGYTAIVDKAEVVHGLARRPEITAPAKAVATEK